MRLSVVTVSFNSVRTIRDTVESFLRQNHPDKELLVIDGASHDGTQDVVTSYRSPDIRLISEPDQGIYDAMNKGLRHFSGDAVGFLNSDDTFHDAHALSHLAHALADTDIAYADLVMVRDHDSKAVVREWRAGSFRPGAFERGWQPPHPTFYVRRAVTDRIGGFDLSYRNAADYDFMLRAMTGGHFKVAYAPHVTADFMVGGASTRDWRATLLNTVESLRARRRHLGAPAVDAALALRLVRRLGQLRLGRNST